jgi:PTS system mannose-specific IID component
MTAAATPSPAPGSASGPTPTREADDLPWRTQASIFVRLLAIQGSWNYEILMGNGIGFCLEPALRRLPGGPHGAAFKAAMARESRYFNAHPYLASVAVGALARAELAGEPAERIERFRTALCGPLGSVGDRLVWAGWLPFCSLAALAIFGLGGGTWTVVGFFLVAYNVGHLGLRAWGLRTGWTHGLRVASALANPVLRRGPQQIGRLAALAAGAALPLALGRVIGPGRNLLGGVLVAIALGSTLIVKLQSRIEGWRLSLIVLAAFILISVIG